MKKFVVTATAVMMLAGASTALAQDRLDRARMLLFDRDWPTAVAELRKVVDDKKAPLRDEAAFWLAHSLFQMGNPPEALKVIEALETDHPRSRWLLPAQSLRVDIATRTGRPDVLWSLAVPTMRTPRSLPANGGTPQPPRIVATPSPRVNTVRKLESPAAPQPPALTMVDVRIQALSGLIQREPDRAVPVLREIVVEGQDTPQARRALFVLGTSNHEGARQTVFEFARTGPEALRVVAVSQLARFPSSGARTVLTRAYESGTGRLKLAVLRSLRNAGGDRELVNIARHETDGDLRNYAVAQLRLLDTPVARAYLQSLK